MEEEALDYFPSEVSMVLKVYFWQSYKETYIYYAEIEERYNYKVIIPHGLGRNNGNKEGERANSHQDFKLVESFEIHDVASVSLQQLFGVFALESRVDNLHDLVRVVEHRVENEKVLGAV
jgi:hypothetical protein